MNERKQISPQEADRLIRAYFEGMTSEEEEKALCCFLASEEGSSERYDEVRAVFSFFAEGKSLYRNEKMSVKAPAGIPQVKAGNFPAESQPSSARRLRLWKTWTAVAAAAVVLLVGGVTLLFHSLEGDYDDSVIIASYTRSHDWEGDGQVDFYYTCTRSGNTGKYTQETHVLAGNSHPDRWSESGMVLRGNRRLAPQELARFVRTCLREFTGETPENMWCGFLAFSETPDTSFRYRQSEWEQAAMASVEKVVRFVGKKSLPRDGAGYDNCCVAYINGKMENNPQIVRQQMLISMERAGCVMFR